jgi:opacity protein-like surface antigen
VHKKGSILTFAAVLLTTTAVIASMASPKWQNLDIEKAKAFEQGITLILAESTGRTQEKVQIAALQIAQLPNESTRSFLTLRDLPSGAKLQQQPFQVLLPGFEFPPLQAERSRIEKFKNASNRIKSHPPIAQNTVKKLQLDVTQAPARSNIPQQSAPKPTVDPKEAWKPTVSFAEKNERGPKINSKPIIVAKTEKEGSSEVKIPEVRETFPPPPESSLEEEQGKSGFYIAARIIGIDKAPSVQAVNGSNLNVKPKIGYAVAGAIGYDWGGFRGEGEVLYAKANLDQIDVNDPGTITGLSAGSFAAEGSQTYAGMLLNGAYDFQNDTGIVPFIMGGVGAVYQSLKDAKAGGIAIPDVSDWALAYQAGAGINIGLVGNVSAELSYRYLGMADGEYFKAGKTHTVAVGAKALF